MADGVTWQWIAGGAITALQAVGILMNTRTYRENKDDHRTILNAIGEDHDARMRLETRVAVVEQLCESRHGPGRREGDARRETLEKILAVTRGDGGNLT